MYNLIRELTKVRVPSTFPGPGYLLRTANVFCHLDRSGFSHWEVKKEGELYMLPDSGRTGTGTKVGLWGDQVRVYTGNKETKKARAKREAANKAKGRDNSNDLAVAMAKAVSEAHNRIKGRAGEDTRLSLVYTFLTDESQRQRAYDALPDDVNPNSPVVLVVEGRTMVRPQEGPWASPNIDLYEEEGKRIAWVGNLKTVEGVCSVTGEKDLIPDIHPGSVKIGDSRAQLLSGNIPQHFPNPKGKLWSTGIGLEAAQQYTTALDYLTTDKNHHLTALHTTTKNPSSSDFQKIVWWGRDEDASLPIYQSIIRPSAEVRTAIEEALEGRGGPVNLEHPFNTLVLGTHVRRLVVLSMSSDTLLGVYQSASRWLRMTETLSVDERGALARKNHSLKALSRALLPRSKEGEWFGKCSPYTTQDILRSMLFREPLTKRLIHGLMTRLERDQQLTTARTALLQVYLHQRGIMADKTQARTPIDPELGGYVGYNLGRLLQEATAIQKAAIRVNRDLSSTLSSYAKNHPRRLYDKTTQKADNHLTSLRTKGDYGLASIFEKRLGAIIGRISMVPKQLPEEQLALFRKGLRDQYLASQAANKRRSQLNNEDIAKDELAYQKAQVDLTLGLIDPEDCPAPPTTDKE